VVFDNEDLVSKQKTEAPTANRMIDIE